MNIEVTKSEIAQVSPIRWEDLNIAERRTVVSQILRRRPDATSQRFAFMVETNNPNFQHYTVVDDTMLAQHKH